jgi:hypothetical protein
MKEKRNENVPYDATMFNLVTDYYRAGAKDKAAKLARKLFHLFLADLQFYNKLSGQQKEVSMQEIQRAQYVLTKLMQLAQENQDTELFNELNKQMGNTDIIPRQ